MEEEQTFTAFSGNRPIASGAVETMLRQTKAAMDGGEADQLLIFDDRTGNQVDFDLRGSADEVVGRLRVHPLFAGGDVEDKPRRGPGRPRLGVVCREVSLLPRHWEWLEQQPNGISAALRRLVDEARKADPGEGRRRLAREAANRFMTALGGNLPGYEEASRALFAGARSLFEESMREWPAGVRTYACRLAQDSFLP